jgi:cell division protein FtsW (lipid II flippase)
MLYVMLFMAGAKLRHLLGIVAAGTILVLLPIPLSTAGMSKEEIQERQGSAYWVHRDDDGQAKTMVLALPLAIMESHQLRRIDGWLHQVDRVDPENKRAVALTQGWGYQLHQSKIVIGSGRALGSGDWEEAEIYFRMLPDDHTDFIFSIIGGQWGFLGCCAVLVLYGVIILFGVEIAASTHDAFGRLLAVGVVGMLLSQILVNIGMTIGLLPITGMTLPLISYGGSSLLVNCAALGLLVNVGQHRPISYARRPFEHKQNTKPVPSGPLEAGRKPTAVGNGGNGAHRG